MSNEIGMIESILMVENPAEEVVENPAEKVVENQNFNTKPLEHAQLQKPIKVNVIDDLNEIHQSQMQALSAIKTEFTVSAKNSNDIVSFKKESFYKLTALQESMNQVINVHYDVCESVFVKLMKRSKISDKSIHTVITFFKEFIQQEQLNIKQLEKVLTIKNIFEDQEQKTQQQLYPSLCEQILIIEQLNKVQAKQCLEQIDCTNAVVKKKLEENIKIFNDGVNEYKARYESLYKKLIESMNKLGKQSKKHLQLYNEMIQSSGSKKKQKDLFYKELKLVNAFDEKIDLQNQLGKLLVNFQNDLTKMERQRYETIVYALQVYLDLQKKKVGSQGLLEINNQIQVLSQFHNALRDFHNCNHKLNAKSHLLCQKY